MIEFGLISVAVMKEQGQHLLEQHYEELTRNKEVIKLNVDWDAYRAMEKSGRLVAIGVWDSGELLGYSVFFLSRHMHYKDSLMALNDVLFLRQDKRKGSLGIKLIKKSENILEGCGVTKILWHCKYGTVAGELLKKLGYVDEEFTVGKLLK